MTDRRTFLKNTALTGIFLTTFDNLFAYNELSEDWTPEASLPINVQEIYCAVLNNKIHMAGGFVFSPGTTGVSDKHLVYDPVKDTWTQLSMLPQPRHHLQLAAHNNKLYGMGGFLAGSADATWQMQDQTWIWDPTTGNWTEGVKAPALHGETVAATLGDRIHIVGGRQPKGSSNATWNDHTDTNHHLIYVPAEDRWEEGAPAPTSRNSAAGAVINGQLYVTGGRTVAGGNVNSLEVYDPNEDQWRTAAPMPQAQGGLAAASANGKLYAFGGEYFDNGGGVYPECWVYDPNKDGWTKGPDMLTPRHGLAGASIGNTIYAIAGAKKAGGNETSNILESFTP